MASQRPVLEERTLIVDEYLARELLRKSRKESEAYLEYYFRQCLEALVEQGKHCSARLHQDVVDVVHAIKSLETFDDILSTLKNRLQHVDDDVLARTIELAARMASMHEIGKWETSASGQGRLLWRSGDLMSCLETYYQKPELDDVVRFESLFDIVAIERIAGFDIVWTDNLAEHLSMYDHGLKQSVRIFHHATFLKANKDVLPPGFADETLRTLALLFPHRKQAIRSWFKRKSKQEHMLDSGILSCGRSSAADRQVKHFHYWRDRLIILKQAFDESEPSTISEWWFDRRKRVQWSTFWVAVLVLLLTIFFGVIQSIEGALQVYKAYNPA